MKNAIVLVALLAERLPCSSTSGARHANAV